MFECNNEPELGIFIVKKENVLFNGTKSNLKEHIKTLKMDSSTEYTVFNTYEADNCILVKDEGIRKVKGNIEDARDFMYTTVLLELEDFDTKTESLIFNLTH